MNARPPRPPCVSLALVASSLRFRSSHSFYLLRGSPRLPGLPFAERIANAESNRDLDALISKVERHLAQNPSDAAGWRVLAPAYRALGRYEAAASAYAEALRMASPTRLFTPTSARPSSWARKAL